MKKGFYSIMWAQFFSSLADNALLVVAIQVLLSMGESEALIPQIKSFFSLSYVLLAAFVGITADAFLKGRVMFATNLIKMLGAAVMLFGANPFIAYGIVGIGAAAYSPAKYGILTELLPAKDLVKANSWIEGATVSSIILGTVLGGMLISDRFKLLLNTVITETHAYMPAITHLHMALCIVLLIYAIAMLINTIIPDTGARYQQHGFSKSQPLASTQRIIVQFIKANKALWTDPAGRISLAVTTLFWGAGAALQFIVLWWAQDGLGLTLSQGAVLQGVTGIGVALGAGLAARYVRLENSFSVLKYGLYMGFIVMIMAAFNKSWLPELITNSHAYMRMYYALAGLFLLMVGAVSGFFVVPMNALLQHRGHTLLSAGQSIAVQNFNENVSILALLALLTALHSYLPTWQIIILFGAFVALIMYGIMRYQANIERSAERLIDEQLK